MPVPPKPSDRRQRRNARAELEIIPRLEANVVVPDPPAKLLEPIQAQWTNLWRSPLAQAWNEDSDLPALQRLFTLYDERERCYRAFRRKRFVEGHKGQPRINPLAPHMAALDSEIRQLEDRFGLSPKARIALGIQFGEMHKTLDDLNRSLDDASNDEAPDPEVIELLNQGAAGGPLDRK